VVFGTAGHGIEVLRTLISINQFSGILLLFRLDAKLIIVKELDNITIA